MLSDLDFPVLPDLTGELYRLLAQIPSGRVTTYGDLAKALGDTEARAARWVGELLAHCKHAVLGTECCCHRVVRQDGEVGLYADGSEAKRCLLRSEDVPITAERVDMAVARWSNFQSNHPLQGLRDVQADWQRRIQLSESPVDVLRWGAVDVAYPQPEVARGAMVVLDTALKVVWSHVLEVPCRFPYIPGYLSFRELPVLLQLWNVAMQENQCPEVLFVDGNGILHHRGIGLASALGVLIDAPTVGVGKSLLCGQVDLTNLSAEETRPILLGGRLTGMALKASDESRPVFVSPGHRTSVNQAANWTRQTLSEHRLPEPIYHADRLTKER